MPIDSSKVQWEPEGPDPSQVQWDSPTPAPAPKKSGVVRRVLGDTVGVDLLGKGLIGAGEAAVGAANLVTGGHAGRALEAIGYDPASARKTLDELYSPERQQANQAVQAADGFLETAGAMLRNPSTIAGAVAESLPSTVAGGAIARGLGAVRTLASPVARAAIGEGAISAGQAAEQSRQQSPDRLLSARQGLAAAGSGIGTGLIAAGSGGVARRLGIADVDVALAGGATGAAARPGLVRRTLQGALTEGALEELPQSAQEQAFQNLGNERPIGEGVAEAGAAGLLTGAAMGGPFAAVASPAGPAEARRAPVQDAPVAAATATPLPDPSAGPLSRAAHEAVRSGATDAAIAEMAAAAAPAATAAGESATSTPAAPTHRLPPPPWIDTTTGEIARVPTLQEGKAYIHEQLNRMEDAGAAPLNRAAWKRELGIGNNTLANTLIGEVKQERARGLRAPAERRVDVMDRLRSLAAPASETDRAALGAKETVGPRDAVRLFSEVLGTEQGAVNDLVAAIPAENGRRDTVAVLQAAQQELLRRQGAEGVAPAAAVSPAAEGASLEPQAAAPAPAPGSLLEGTAPVDRTASGSDAPDDSGPALGPASPGSSDLGTSSQATPAAEPVQDVLAPRPAATVPGSPTSAELAPASAAAPSPATSAPAAPAAAEGEVALASAEDATPPRGKPVKSERVDVAAVSLDGRAYPVASLADARSKFREVVEAADVGASQTPNVQLLDAAGNVVGHFSYNGRAWAGQPGTIDREIMDDGTVLSGKALERRNKERLRPTGGAPGETTEQANARIIKALDDSIAAAGLPPVDAAPESKPASDIEAAAHAAATSPQNDLPAPTEGQMEAGNYKKGHARVAGLDISIENPAGTRRRPEWPPLANHYGYIRGTVGKDKDHVDVFMTEAAHDTSRPVFVVDQKNSDGTFDEHKVILGVANKAAARRTYLANYSKGWKGLGAITRMSQEEFKAWVMDPAKTKRPAAQLAAATAPKRPRAAVAEQPAAPAPPVAAAAAAAAPPPGEVPDVDLDAVKKNPAFRKAMKAIDEALAGGAKLPATDGQGLAEAAMGWADGKAGRPPRAPRTDASKLTRGMDPVDFYISAYASARGGAVGAVRARAAGALYERFAPTAKPTAGEKVAAGSRQPTTAEKAGAVKAAAGKSSTAANPARTTEIHDVGEKIGGARKDQWRDRGLQVSDLAGMTGGEQAEFATKANVWKPDYAALVAGGASRDAVALVKVLWDKLPPKPTTDTEAARRSYVEALNIVKELLSEAKTVEQVAAAPKAFRARSGRDAVTDRLSSLRDYQERVPLYAALAKRSGYRTRFWDQVTFADRSKASTLLATDWPVKSKTSTGGGTTKRPEPVRPHLDNVPRTGRDYRQGKDVAAEDFRKAFGFRGVEFGNWAAQDERQKLVNLAYDGLQDMAQVLGIPPAAISLNGTLGLALGARGKGSALAHYEPGKVVINLTKINGAGALAHEWGHALDHYFGELDRPNAYGGAGRYISGGRGRPADFHRQTSEDFKNLRPEMQRGWADVLKAIYRGATPKAEKVRELELQLEQLKAKIADVERGQPRPGQVEAMKSVLQRISNELEFARGEPEDAEWDAGDSGVIKAIAEQGLGPYWKRPTELVARSFEAYVNGKIRATGEKSQYLVSVPSNPVWPQGGDLARVTRAFDKLFATVKTRETEKGVALFSKAPPAPFRQQVAESLRAEEARGPMLEVSRTPALMRMLGFPDLPLRMPPNVLHKIAGGKRGTRAGLTEQQIARLPELIDDPVAVFRDPKYAGNLLVLTSLVDSAGQPVVVALKPNGADRYDRVNLVASAFGRGDAENWLKRVTPLLAYRGEKANPRLSLSGLDQRQTDEGSAEGSPQKVLGPADLRNFRAAARDSRFSKGQDTPGTAVSPARARELLGELTRNWGDNAPAIRLVTSAEQLPASVRADPDAARIEGLYEGKPVVWLNLGRIQTEQRFAQVLAHEAIGHYGVERVVGAERWADIVDAIERVDRSGGGSAVLRQVFADVRRKQPDAAADRVTFAKEVIAFLAERGVRNSWVNRVVAAVRRFLRRLMPSLRWNEAEVRDLLGQADSFLHRSSTPAERRALVRQYSFSRQGTPFYSALVNAIDLAKGAPKKGDAAAWKGWLDGAQRRGEFRQAEREWLDIDGFLERNGTTTREQLLEYVRANELQVQDVVLGDPADANLGTDPEALFMAVSNLVQEKHGQVDADVEMAIEEWVAGDIESVDLARQADLPVADIELLQEQNRPRSTSFGQYTLPGGENYRELLLTLPQEKVDAEPVDTTGWTVETVSDEAYYRYTGQREIRVRDARGDVKLTRVGFRGTDEEAIAEAAQAFQRDDVTAQRDSKDFRSSHFDQPNILAHVRFNERTDADGKRVLFLEEIQSDWHQAGRKRGYGDRAELERRRREAEARVERLEEQRTAVLRRANALPDGPEFEAAIDEAERIKREIGEAQDAARALRQQNAFDLVPDAPFKATDEWAMLAFKRMVRWAADHGFDRIAWTTGQQQADRYDLAKTVSEVSYSDKSRLIVRDKGGSVIYNETTPENRIADVIGKEAAERLLSQPSRDWSSQAGSIGARARAISGDGLKMGGEGMRAFYDKILPAAVNKWGKRFGAKVGQADIGRVTNELSVRDAGEGPLRVAGNPVHSIDITPEMREAAVAGLPLFSKAPAEVLDDVTAVMDANQPENVLERARAALRDMVPAKAKDQLRGTWLGALATRHLTELGSDYFKNIKHYSDFLAEMGADRNQLQQEGEAIAERARKWAGKHRGEARQLFDLMHDATIDGVDPAEGYQPLQFRYGGQLHEVTPKKIKEALAAIREQMRGRAGDNKTDMLAEAKTLRGMPAREKRRRQKYPGLVQRWNQLSPEAQKIYVEFREAYKARSAAIEQALVDRIQDTDVPASHKQKIIAVIRQQFETQRLQGVYFPLQRHGRYFVAAEKQDTPVFLMFDRLTELEGAVRDLKRRGFKVTAQGLKSAGKAQDAPSGTFVAEVIQSLQKAGVSDKTQDEIYQLYLQTLPELSMRKHAIHRQSVPGFDPDAVRAFAFNMHHGAHQLARLRFGHKLQAVLDLLSQQQNAARAEGDADTRKIAAGDAILQELAKRHEWIMDPQDSQATSLVSSFGFIYYLGLSPAAALVNLTQTALVTYPYLASRHGPIKAMNHLLAGAGASIRTAGNIQRTLTDPDELRAHAFLQKSGALDKSLAHNLAGIAEGGLSGYNPAWARAMEIIGWGFHKAEVVNREAAGMAAFRLAKAEGASFNEAVRAAVDAINDTHFDYTNQNRARFMQSGTAKVLLMFRQYSLNMTWHLGRMVWQATKGESPEVRKLARRNLTGVLGMSALFSGVLGLPLMSVTMGALNAIASSAGDDDEPWDAETEFRAFLAEMFGPSVASLLLSGAVNAATGADLASRVSLSQLWFRDADRELDGRGRYYALLEQAAGPMGGVLKNALVGKQLMDEGHLWRGVETTLPKSLKDGMRAARYAQEGVNTLRGDPLVEDATLRDTLLQLAGFTPAKVADRYDRNRALKNYEQTLLERRGRLMDAFAMARRLGDSDGSRDVLEQIRAFNRKNPEIAITAASIRRSLGQRARYSARAEHGITLDRRLARRVREAVGD